MSIVQAGTTNLAAVQVPNVLVQIIPPNPLLNGVPTNIIGVVGTSIYGPVNAPTVVGSMAEYIQMFGTPEAALYDMGTQVYTASLQTANNFTCVRVTDGTDIAATVDVADTMSGVGAILDAKYTGALGNTINAIISAGSMSSTYKLTLYFQGGSPEVFDNIGGSGAAIWSNLVNAVNLGQSSLRGPSQICNATTNTGISSVTVNAAGSYTTLPTVNIIGPGSDATFVVHMDALTAAPSDVGSDYAPADTITLTGGTHSTAAIATVETTQLVSLSLNAAGSGYQVGDTIVLEGGTSSIAAILTVETVNGSGDLETFTITTAGSYTVNSATFTQGSTSGVGSGATFETGLFGVLTATVTTAGNYTALPSNPVSQGATSGSGTGATLNMTWGVLSVAVTAAGTGYTEESLIEFSGSGGALAVLVLSSANPPNIASYVLSGGTNGNLDVTDATLIGTDGLTRTGMYSLRKSGASIGILADQTVAVSNWGLQAAFGASEGIYMIAPIAAGYQENIAGAIAVKTAAAVANYELKVMMGDWVYLVDPFNNVTRLVSPQGYVAGVLATQLPSGSSLNKIMVGVAATQKSADNLLYSDADLLALENAGIDVITNNIPANPSAGVFGVRLGINTSGMITTNGDNYSRMINFLAETFNAGLGDFIGLPQTTTVQNQARSTLQNFLQNLVFLGLIGSVSGGSAFRVILDSTNNPPNRVALGYMQADVQVTLFSIIQVFVVNLQAGQSVQITTLPPQLAA